MVFLSCSDSSGTKLNNIWNFLMAATGYPTTTPKDKTVSHFKRIVP